MIWLVYLNFVVFDLSIFPCRTNSSVCCPNHWEINSGLMVHQWQSKWTYAFLFFLPEKKNRKFITNWCKVRKRPKVKFKRDKKKQFKNLIFSFTFIKIGVIFHWIIIQHTHTHTNTQRPQLLSFWWEKREREIMNECRSDCHFSLQCLFFIMHFDCLSFWSISVVSSYFTLSLSLYHHLSIAFGFLSFLFLKKMSLAYLKSKITIINFQFGRKY